MPNKFQQQILIVCIKNLLITYVIAEIFYKDKQLQTMSHRGTNTKTKNMHTAIFFFTFSLSNVC